MTIGIYLLRFTGTDKVYIGQSKDIERRYSDHLYDMKHNQSAYKLQQAYNLYGLPNYEILVECEQNELNTNENMAIEIFDSAHNGFNTSIESCQVHAGNKNYGENAPMAKYTNQQILEAVQLMCDPEISFHKIAELTGISYYSIKKIHLEKNHKWIQEHYPELWNKAKAAADQRLQNIYSQRAEHNKSIFNAKAQGIVYPKVINSVGIVHTIDNLSEFCRQYNLETERTNFRNMLKGKRKSCKGWKLVDGEIPYQS